MLEDAVQAGKIRVWGVTNTAIAGALAAQTAGNLVSFSYEFSLSKRKYEKEILDTIGRSGMTFLSWEAWGRVSSSGKYDENTHFEKGDRRTREIYINFTEEGRKRNLRIVEAMREIRRAHPRTAWRRLRCAGFWTACPAAWPWWVSSGRSKSQMPRARSGGRCPQPIWSIWTRRRNPRAHWAAT